MLCLNLGVYYFCIVFEGILNKVILSIDIGPNPWAESWS